MKKVTTIADWRQIYADIKVTSPSTTIGFVPTMGYLHEGHLSLVQAAREECELVVMSIFINPLQFGENEDFDRYPRDMERDEALARHHGVDYLFVPDVREMYPQEPLTRITVSSISEVMCGRMRPGHFDGVTQVVAKLFNIVQPDRAYFGLKDAQQVAVIQQMVNDLNMPVEVRACPIVREPDGLAMSSRNVYLSREERLEAVQLYKSLSSARVLIEQGVRDADQIIQHIEGRLENHPAIQLEYVEIRSFPELIQVAKLKNRVIIAIAARIGQTRLIDNFMIDIDNLKEDQGGKADV